MYIHSMCKDRIVSIVKPMNKAETLILHLIIYNVTVFQENNPTMC